MGMRRGSDAVPRIKIFVGNFVAPGGDAPATSYPRPALTSEFRSGYVRVSDSDGDGTLWLKVSEGDVS